MFNRVLITPLYFAKQDWRGKKLLKRCFRKTFTFRKTSAANVIITRYSLAALVASKIIRNGLMKNI